MLEQIGRYKYVITAFDVITILRHDSTPQISTIKQLHCDIIDILESSVHKRPGR